MVIDTAEVTVKAPCAKLVQRSPGGVGKKLATLATLPLSAWKLKDFDWPQPDLG
jgi:hypothetical protein